MLLTIGQAVAGLVLLYFGGDLLIRGSSALASRFGVSRLAVGLTVVAFGTSAPELVVSLDAALAGASDIAVGNIVGSNIANLALILGLSALLRPLVVESKLLRVDVPVLLTGSVALLFVLIDGRASRLEGLILLGSLAAYSAFTLRRASREPDQLPSEFAEVAPGTAPTAGRSVVFTGVGLLLLIGGGHLLVGSAMDLAILLGIGQAAIGLTVVALGTSIPELTTSVLATMRGQGDIAIGNLIGSNIFNIFGILGFTAVVRPLAMGAITWIDLGSMIAVTLLASLFLLTRLRVERLEGAFLLAGFLLYTGWVLS